MHTYRSPALLLAVIFSLGVTIASAQNDDAASVREQLKRAKKEFKEEEKKYRETIEEYFSYYEEAARKSGDKKTVDRVKAARDAFAQWGDLPEKAPRQQFLGARASLARTYKAAIKDFTRLKLDHEAATAEKEYVQFLVDSAVLADRKTYLVSLKHFNVKAEKNWFTNNGASFTLNGTPMKMNGRLVPHSIFIHPPARGFSQVSYPLAGKWSLFRVTVGFPTRGKKKPVPQSPAIFQVLADDESIWQSKPIKKSDEFETCILRVDEVKVLTLRAHCEGGHAEVWASWFEPILVER